MNILMIYPKYPDSFWSFKHALSFISKKAAVPPLGLITVSAMLPKTWQKKLVDLNVSNLMTEDILWADYVFISAMYIQKESVSEIIEECLKYNVKIIAGGPLFTQEYENYPQIDHFILNEAEITLPLFMDDYNSGKKPKKIYKTNRFADLTETPVPEYHLLARNKYANMNLQFSRGCPNSCDFCEITSLLGHKVRMKKPEQIINELEVLYKLKWRGPVSIVDDNFIGNRKEIKNHLLPAMKNWMQKHKYPFKFSMQTSINLADDEELMSLLMETGFECAFVGVETPDEKSLKECNKFHNEKRDMLESIKKLQKSGLHVSGGFIVGFDSDEPTIFQRQIDFIQQSGIVAAMVGLLNAPKNTKLYNRLKESNRLIAEGSGNNTDFSMNFIPKMNTDELLEGYRKVIQNIYSSKPYYKRVRKFLLNYKRPRFERTNLKFYNLKGFIKSVFIIGIAKKGRLEYWKLLLWTLIRRPKLFAEAITYAVYGYHFRKVYGLSK